MQIDNVSGQRDRFSDLMDLIHVQHDYSRNKTCKALLKPTKLPENRLPADLVCALMAVGSARSCRQICLLCAG